MGSHVLDQVGVAADVEDASHTGPHQGRARRLGLALVLFLVLGSGGLDDMQRAALEGLGGHLATGIFRLLGAARQDIGHSLAVFAGIGDDRQGYR